MCLPLHLDKILCVKEIALRMAWETRETMDESEVIPYGVFVDPTTFSIDGLSRFKKDNRI